MVLRGPCCGKGGGQASANIPNGLISDQELLAIWQGGIDIHPLIDRDLSLRWLAKKEVHYREASLYFWSWQIMYT